MHDTDEGGHVFKNDNLIKDSTSNLQNTNSKDTIPNYLQSNKENIHNYLNIKNMVDSIDNRNNIQKDNLKFMNSYNNDQIQISK